VRAPRAAPAATPPRRLVGEPAARRALAAWATGELAGEVLRDNPRRQLVRVETADAGALLLKRFRTASGRHPLRERWKEAAGRGPARREWEALRALADAGVPVPTPLALGTLAQGDPVLAMRWVEGRPLREVLGEGRRARRAILASLARSVAALHDAGFVHGDLHHGNVLVAGEETVLLDLQRARRTRRRRARLDDLGWLDYALWPDLSRSDRLRLRAGALGHRRPFDAAARHELAAVDRAATRRAEAHARSRTRRSLRPGRRFALHRWGAWTGLRDRSLAPDAVDAILRAHVLALAEGGPKVLKDDRRSRITGVAAGGQRVVVKEAPPRGAGRALTDLVRGSAGRRAWRGGHGLCARGIGAARPLAWLERRAFGVPVASLVVLEDLRPATPADVATLPEPVEVLQALASLACALHGRGVDHGDLKASHVFVAPGGRGTQARLVDLEGVRFRRWLPESRRLRALAELNASLPDRFPAAARRAAFARYTAALPFAGGSREALARLVRHSLERRHRWTGADCALAVGGTGAADGSGASRPAPGTASGEKGGPTRSCGGG